MSSWMEHEWRTVRRWIVTEIRNQWPQNITSNLFRHDQNDRFSLKDWNESEILYPPFWIFTLWLRIRDQRPQNTPSKHFRVDQGNWSHSKLGGWLTSAILDPPYWIFTFWLWIRDQRPLNPLEGHYQPVSSNFLLLINDIRWTSKICDSSRRHIGAAMLDFSQRPQRIRKSTSRRRFWALKRLDRLRRILANALSRLTWNVPYIYIKKIYIWNL